MLKRKLSDYSPDKQIVIASFNPNKTREIQNLLAAQGWNSCCARELGIEPVQATGDSFIDNALIKAKNAYAQTGTLSIADDSGVSVPVLGNKPGVHSRQWVSKAGIRGALYKLYTQIHFAGYDLTQTPITAMLRCALAVVYAEDDACVYEGSVTGFLVWPPRGSNGCGFDPMFVRLGETRTLAEMTRAEKNAHSHRSHALSLLKRDWTFT